MLGSGLFASNAHTLLWGTLLLLFIHLYIGISTNQMFDVINDKVFCLMALSLAYIKSIILTNIHKGCNHIVPAWLFPLLSWLLSGLLQLNPGALNADIGYRVDPLNGSGQMFVQLCYWYMWYMFDIVGSGPTRLNLQLPHLMLVSPDNDCHESGLVCIRVGCELKLLNHELEGPIVESTTSLFVILPILILFLVPYYLLLSLLWLSIVLPLVFACPLSIFILSSLYLGYFS